MSAPTATPLLHETLTADDIQELLGPKDNPFFAELQECLNAPIAGWEDFTAGSNLAIWCESKYEPESFNNLFTPEVNLFVTDDHDQTTKLATPLALKEWINLTVPLPEAKADQPRIPDHNAILRRYLMRHFGSTLANILRASEKQLLLGNLKIDTGMKLQKMLLKKNTNGTVSIEITVGSTKITDQKNVIEAKPDSFLLQEVLTFQVAADQDKKPPITFALTSIANSDQFTRRLKKLQSQPMVEDFEALLNFLSTEFKVTPEKIKQLRRKYLYPSLRTTSCFNMDDRLADPFLRCNLITHPESSTAILSDALNSIGDLSQIDPTDLVQRVNEMIIRIDPKQYQQDHNLLGIWNGIFSGNVRILNHNDRDIKSAWEHPDFKKLQPLILTKLQAWRKVPTEATGIEEIKDYSDLVWITKNRDLPYWDRALPSERLQYLRSTYPSFFYY